MITPPEDFGETPEQTKNYQLPYANDFEGVNENFNTLSDYITGIIGEMREHTDSTNQNLVRLAEETSQIVDKLSQELRSILSAQTMIAIICVLSICLMFAIIHGMWKTIGLFIH